MSTEFFYAFALGCIVGVIGSFVGAFWLLQSMRERTNRRMRR